MLGFDKWRLCRRREGEIAAQGMRQALLQERIRLQPREATQRRSVVLRRLRTRARKSRPFQRELPAPEDERSPEELLTEAYLKDLAGSDWGEDPPGHRSGEICSLTTCVYAELHILARGAAAVAAKQSIAAGMLQAMWRSSGGRTPAKAHSSMPWSDRSCPS